MRFAVRLVTSISSMLVGRELRRDRASRGMPARSACQDRGRSAYARALVHATQIELPRRSGSRGRGKVVGSGRAGEAFTSSPSNIVHEASRSIVRGRGQDGAALDEADLPGSATATGACGV